MAWDDRERRRAAEVAGFAAKSAASARSEAASLLAGHFERAGCAVRATDLEDTVEAIGRFVVSHSRSDPMRVHEIGVDAYLVGWLERAIDAIGDPPGIPKGKSAELLQIVAAAPMPAKDIGGPIGSVRACVAHLSRRGLAETCPNCDTVFALPAAEVVDGIDKVTEILADRARGVEGASTA